MNINDFTTGPSQSDFATRLQTMGFNAAGARAVLTSILNTTPGDALTQPGQPPKE